MKKTIISLVAICTIGLCALAGCDSTTGGSNFAISNKDELQAEWHVTDSTRQIEFTCDDEDFNVSALISSGDLTVESSDSTVVGVVGSLLYPLSEGTATITAKYGKGKDTVDLTVLAAPALPYELGKEYYLAEEANGVTYYFTGNVISEKYDYEGEMSPDLSEAVAVKLSAADGDDAYYMSYTKSGTTYYVCIVDKDGYQDLQLLTTPTPIYYYASNDAWVNAEATYYLGWHSTYNCLYANSISGIDTYQHAYLIDPSDASASTSVLATPVTSVSAGTEYNLGIVLKSVQYYFNGSIQNSFYLDVTTDGNSAAVVTLTEVEDVENGYNITFEKNDTTQIFYAYTDNASHYTSIFATEGNVPSVGDASGSNTITDVTTTYVWDASICGFKVTLDGTECTLGLRSDSSYTEIALATTDNPTVAQLYAVA